MDRRLNIGLMISDLEEAYAETVCRGAIIGAEEIDANLFIFPGGYIDNVYADQEYSKYEYQHNTLFSYAFPEEIDVLLVLAGAIGNCISNERKKEFLDGFGNIPVITLSCEIDGYPSVCFDNRSGMRECIEHLVTEHKCTRIGFVSGPETNSEAIERMSVYAQVLRRHGMILDQNRIAYGDFTGLPNTQNAVRELLDRCPDLEAIVFANDGMAVGAYEVFKERGMEVGHDILVTGFDNIPESATLTPPLTTVNADASELGYSAVIECLKLRDNIPIRSIKVRSTMVKRRSCGCLSNSGPYDKRSSQKDIFVFNHYLCRSDEQTVSTLCKYLFDNYKTSSEIPKVMEKFTQYFQSVFKLLRSDDQGGITLTEEAKEFIPAGFENLMTNENMKYIDNDKLCRVIDYLTDRFTAVLESTDDKKDITLIFISLYQVYIKAAVTHCEDRVDDMRTFFLHSNSITKDMLLFDNFDDSGYTTVTGKLMALNVRSSYLYLFEDPITHKNEQKWYPPAKVLFKTYHNDGVVGVMPAGEQSLSIRRLLDHKYIPKDRRLTMVLSALFLNENHYGLLLCEIDPGYFHYIKSIVAQLCAAMKILRIIQDKGAIQLELEETLAEIKERNLHLDTVSKHDDLTGVCNRRGFFAEANSIISSPENDGRAAMIIFAALDGLKEINDSFGHEDGDFAVKSAAKILSDSFRDPDIIGRIGGGDFSVFSMADSESSAEEIEKTIRDRIEEASDNFNKGQDKPFIIKINVAVCTFDCGIDAEISKIIAQADNILYTQKENRTSVLRSEGALPLYQPPEA